MNYKALPDNQEYDFTPVVPAARCKFTLSVQKYKLIMQHHCVLAGNTERTDLGVGEEVGLKFDPVLFLNDFWVNIWSTTAGSVFPTNGNGTTFTAPSNAADPTVTATLGGEQCDRTFAVYAPTGVAHADITATVPYFQGHSGAGMQLAVYLGPTNVSFYRVQCMEVGQDASSVTNYYVSYMNSPAWPDNLSHRTHGADVWILVGCDNSWQGGDTAAWGDDPSPWYPGGGFTWVIPGKWTIPGTSTTNDITLSDQTFSLSADGTMTVQKFGHTVTRKTNGQYITVE
jgi:hypothetical protein